MKKPSRLLLAALLLTTLIGHPADPKAANNLENLANGDTAFALDLYARLKNADGNLFFSPYSISTCVAMTYAGARGDTAAQMARTLHFATNQIELADSFRELQQELSVGQHKMGIELDVANGLWGQKDHPFLPAFLDVAKQSYGANLKQVDFRTGSESARIEINDWASDQTQGKITDLIQPGVLDQSTRLVLLNAIYFKGRWAREFDMNNTTRAPFLVSPTQKPEVSLMHVETSFTYTEVDGLQLLELPYAGGDMAMVVLLPRETDGLKRLEERLDEPSLDRWMAAAFEQKVDVFLPKFRQAAQFNLARPLAAMGMTDAFSRRADFSGMDGQPDLFISAIVHKAFVEVNEAGTVAAAATGVVVRSMAVMMAPRPTPIFRADHPFIFLIRDTHSGSILFLGRMVDPAPP